MAVYHLHPALDAHQPDTAGIPFTTIQALQKYDLLAEVPEQRVRELGLERYVQGAFPLRHLSGTTYLAASVIAQVVQQHPELHNQFGRDVKLDDLVLPSIADISLPADTAKERLDYLVKHGIIQADNNQVPIEHIDIVLKDYIHALSGNPIQYESPVVELSERKKGDRWKTNRYSVFSLLRGWESRVHVSEEELVERYMRQVKQYPLLTADETRELTRRYRQGDMEAREQLITSNLRIVVRIAHQYKRYGLSLLDLIQEGNIGLVSAVERYDPKKSRLTTFAYPWIKSKMRHAIIKSTQLAINKGALQRFARIRSIEMEEESNGHARSREQIAEELGYSKQQLKIIELAAMRADAVTESLDDIVHEDGTSRGTVIPAQDELAEQRYINAQEQHRVKTDVHEALSHLPSRERRIVEAYFGFFGDKETHRSIAEREGISHERVRQILMATLESIEGLLSPISQIREATLKKIERQAKRTAKRAKDHS
ncbi:sigma-70 family RNA polymerase sigma factor [Candidatus Woesearchaeota archaeon]|nr:sigma-70 family RNA polymerase sigma factor [Candidatus Woesearchaeota archaeon]